MKITVYPKRTDTSAQILYRLGSPMEIGSGETKTFRGNYTDPTGGGATANAISSTMITPVATTDYLMWTASDGTGTNLTAYLSVSVVYGTEAPTYTVTNTSSYLAYITKLQARGYGIYSDNPIETNQENAASYLKYGYQTASKRELLQRDVTYAEAKSIIEREKLPRTVLTEVSLEANSCEELMMIFLNCDIGYLVGVQSDRAEIDGRYYIQRITYTVTPGGLINYTWDVVQSFSLYSGLTLIAAEFATREVVPAVPSGADPYCMSLLHMNGADGSTTITDEVAGKTWTAYNGAQIDTAIKKLGSGSCLFDGTNDYISTGPSASWDLGSNDWTIEWYEYRTSNGAGMKTISLQNADWVNTHMYLILGIESSGNNCVIMCSGNGTGTDIAYYKSLGAQTLNAWVHFAVCRQGSTFRCFKNGTLTDTWTSAISFSSVLADATLLIGMCNTGTPEYFKGQVDEFRFTNGTCRYTADFTPPVVEFVATTPAVAAVYGGGALNFGHIPQITDLTIRTISTWLYFDQGGFGATNAYAPLFMYTEDSDLYSGNNIDVFAVGGDANFRFITGSFAFGGSGRWYSESPAFTRLTWTHVLISYEQQNIAALPIFYVNGTLIPIRTGGGYDPIQPTGAYKSENGCTLKIGARKDTIYDYTTSAMIGLVKDYRIYNRLPNATERALLVSEGPGGASVTSGLVFQTPCVYTKQLTSYIGQDITATNRILDNVYGNIGDGRKSQVGITGIYPVGRAI
jgi:hypothetical protein